MPANHIAEPAIEKAFRSFLDICHEVHKEHVLQIAPNIPPDDFGVEEGRILWRIVRFNHSGQKLVFGFVDKRNGDILKAETFKKPARHVRGNILNKDNGRSAVDPFGIRYLR